MKRDNQEVNAGWPSALKRVQEAARNQPLPWAGTAAEDYLKRITADERMWPDIWSKVELLVRLWNAQPVPSAANPSKQARSARRFAARCNKKGDAAASALFEFYGEWFATVATRLKRHGINPHNRFLLEFMLDIRAMAGRWCDAELAALMRCAGYHHTIETAIECSFRTLRARNRAYMKWL